MTKCAVVMALMYAAVVPTAAAAEFAGWITQARGAVASVVLKLTVQVAVLAEPMVMLPLWSVLPATTAPFVVAPQAPEAIVGKPIPVKDRRPLNVTAPVALRVVNAPVLAAVLPIGPGEAKRAVKPAPETVLLALSVVNAPAPFVPPVQVQAPPTPTMQMTCW